MQERQLVLEPETPAALQREVDLGVSQLDETPIVQLNDRETLELFCRRFTRHFPVAVPVKRPEPGDWLLRQPIIFFDEREEMVLNAGVQDAKTLQDRLGGINLARQ